MSERLIVSFTPRADRHVENAGMWWRENRTKAPEAFVEDLEEALELISTQPHVGAIARNVRLKEIRRGWDRVKGEGLSLQITTTQTIDEVATRVKEGGGILESEPADTPCGVRVFRLRDPMDSASRSRRSVLWLSSRVACQPPERDPPCSAGEDASAPPAKPNPRSLPLNVTPEFGIAHPFLALP